MALQAGDIVFDIKGDDTQLKKALEGVRGHFASTSKAVGAAMTVVGGAITGFATVAINDFIETGSAINDMALRTGFGTTALQELGYAAGLSGGSMGDVEKAAKKMSTVIFGAGEEAKAAGDKQAAAWAKGSTEVVTATGSYTDALAMLGLNYAQLQAMKPEEQFTTIGFALANVGDATTRAALAQEMFGRAGTSLLPMLSEGSAGFAAMAAEAQRLGLIMDADSVAAADRLGDEIDKLKAGMKGLGFDIAEVIVPSLLELMGSVRGVMDSFSAWRDQNPALFDSIAKIVIIVGAVMTVLGPLLMLLPGLATAWTATSAAVSAAGAVFSAIAAAIGAPVVAVVAAIAAIVAAGVGLYYYWEEIKNGLISVWNAITAAWFWAWGPIIDGILWLKDVGLSVLEKAAGWVGLGGGGGGGQYMTMPGGQYATAYGGGGGMALAGGSAGGGGGQTIYMTINTMATDGAGISRTIADQLRLELRARGI